MKTFLFLFLLASPCFSQSIIRDSIISAGRDTVNLSTWADSSYAALSVVDSLESRPDTSHFYTEKLEGSQISILAVTTEQDTLIVQQKISWGKLANRDSAWVPIRVISDSNLCATDSIFIINRSSGGVVYGEVTLPESIIADQWRIIRSSPETELPHRIYLTITRRYLNR